MQAIDTTVLTRDVHAVFLHLMRRAHGEVFRAIADLDLSLTQIKTLHTLDDAGELPVTGLADALGVSLPAMSRCVDGLHARGLVSREENPDDRRCKRVSVTAPGRDVPRRLHEARLSHIEEFVAGLEPDEAERLAAALGPIAARLEVGR